MDSKSKAVECYSCSNVIAHLKVPATSNYTAFFALSNDPNAVWSHLTLTKRKKLKVHFLNKKELGKSKAFKWYYNGDIITAGTIIDWSNEWWSAGKLFEKVDSVKDADIRVKFCDDKPSECKIGAYAETVTSPNPTMWLNLSTRFAPGDANKKHTVIHEFGHALGVLHEHERPDVWDSIRPFLDMTKIDEYHGVNHHDVNIHDGHNLDTHMAGDPDAGHGHYFRPITTYDSSSIMHYPWAGMGFLKEGYQTEDEVMKSRAKNVIYNDDGKLVSDDQYKTLIEIIRAYEGPDQYIKTKPSELDKQGLREAYNLQCVIEVSFCLESGALLFDHDELSGDKGFYVCGSFNEWKEKIEMLPNALGQHTATVDLPVGKHEYKFLVEGKWCHHSDMPFVHNDRGTYNNEVNVTQKHIDAYNDEQSLTDYECPPKSVVWF